MDESRMFLLKRGCGCLNLDEIVKDIRDRKDNAMAMEFTKCIGELLKKNGVVPKITEYSGISQTDKTFESRYGVSIDELDFSEHDKVFEDKIKKLRGECDKLHKQLMETEKDMQKENESLKQKLSNKDKKIAELTWKNDELQQRISELESKETETCEKEPISNDCRPSIEWYDNRHQSDCIEINRLNTTIDVLIHKIEYLRQLAGLE